LLVDRKTIGDLSAVDVDVGTAYAVELNIGAIDEIVVETADFFRKCYEATVLNGVVLAVGVFDADFSELRFRNVDVFGVDGFGFKSPGSSCFGSEGFRREQAQKEVPAK
jgi:hypothetical protein